MKELNLNEISEVSGGKGCNCVCRYSGVKTVDLGRTKDAASCRSDCDKASLEFESCN